MKKFMILLCVLFSIPALAAEETVVVGVDTTALVADFNQNVWAEATLSSPLCGSENIVTAQTNEKDVGFFRMRTMLSQAQATGSQVEITMDCETNTLTKVILM